MILFLWFKHTLLLTTTQIRPEHRQKPTQLWLNKEQQKGTKWRFSVSQPNTVDHKAEETVWQEAAAYKARWLVICCRCNGHQRKLRKWRSTTPPGWGSRASQQDEPANGLTIDLTSYRTITRLSDALKLLVGAEDHLEDLFRLTKTVLLYLLFFLTGNWLEQSICLQGGRMIFYHFFFSLKIHIKCRRNVACGCEQTRKKNIKLPCTRGAFQSLEKHWIQWM